jgi:hypothetical protein
MWMTGFDVPSCSTIYLDKPMRNHTLMQTIARANRVFPGKVSGMIVDYATKNSKAPWRQNSWTWCGSTAPAWTIWKNSRP